MPEPHNSVPISVVVRHLVVVSRVFNGRDFVVVFLYLSKKHFFETALMNKLLFKNLVEIG